MVLRICKFCSLPSMVAHSAAGHKTNATRDRRQSEQSPRRASVSHTDDGFTHSERRRSTHVTLIPTHLPTSPNNTKTTSDPVFPPRSTKQHRTAPDSTEPLRAGCRHLTTELHKHGSGGPEPPDPHRATCHAVGTSHLHARLAASHSGDTPLTQPALAMHRPTRTRLRTHKRSTGRSAHPAMSAVVL